ncbi:MAG TPA: kinase/pyrophosphorylase, partial [Thioalkalivibrio sp.]|nr:kinase/pyrophosphorylase [Thioalkalivibrio sp.]
DDFDSGDLPGLMTPYRNKLFGLTVDPERLQQIRSERRPDSPYSSPEQCRRELIAAEALFRREKIPFINITFMSVEEIAATLLHEAGLKKRL